MSGGWLALVLAVFGSGPPDEPETEPAKLVARLGSHHAAERAAAAEALEKIGSDALPAVRAARFGSTDLVLRMRAAAVLDAIEGRRLTRATMVKLDFENRPLPEVLDALSARTGMTLMLGPDPVPNRPPTMITLTAPEPVPFWSAVDRLCKEGGLTLDPETGAPWRMNVMNIVPPGQPPRKPLIGNEMVFLHGDTTGRGGAVPTCDFGPFQLRLISIHLSRSRSFVALPQPKLQPGSPSHETERFDAQLQVIIEPRLSVVQLGEVTALDAHDDLGQSLQPEPVSVGVRPYPTRTGYGGRSGSVAIHLKYPERPGKSIVRLSGRVQATVAARKPDPLVISLTENLGHPFHNDEATVVVREVKTEPNTKAMLVELSVASQDGSGRSSGFQNPNDNRLGLDVPNMTLPQFDFVDAQGRVCPSMPMGMGFQPDGLSRTFRINPVEGVGPPTQVRYHGLDWATLEVPFAYHDLPMP